MSHPVKSGNNMPIHAPLIPDPFVPYECPKNRSLNVVCRVETDHLDELLRHTPFSRVGDLVLIYISDFRNCNKVPFMDAGIVVPVDYDGRRGGYFLFEYEDEDAAIAAGRDLWGYPKKYGEIDLVADENGARGTVTRKGVPIISLECAFAETAPAPAIQVTPHINIHVQPGPDGSIFNRRIIERDTSSDFQKISEQHGKGSAQLESIPTDDLAKFRPVEILGASYVVGDFFATEANGWGRVIGTY